MLLGTLIIILSVALILTVIGLFFRNILFSLIGTISIFMLGIMLLTNPLQYKVGENIGLLYGVDLNASWDSEGGSVPANSEPYVFSTNSTNIYENYSDSFSHTFSYLLMILGALAFVLLLFIM